MAVYKEEKTNTWRAVYRYTDWNGERKQTQKRGFKTKREAQAWEREQLNKASADLDMTFKSFVDHYTADMKTRLKENTWSTKEHIIRTKLLPYFGKLKMCKITAQQSHISLLIDMGFTALAIAERVGHESIDITYRYAHLFPTRQVEMADKLDSLKNEKGGNEYEKKDFVL